MGIEEAITRNCKELYDGIITTATLYDRACLGRWHGPIIRFSLLG
jgi:hypothetical protein